MTSDNAIDNSVPIPRTLEPPPRSTGNASLDLPILLDWFYRAYQVIQESVDYINVGSISENDNISLLNNDSGYIGTDYYELEDDLIKFTAIIRGESPSASSDLTTKNYVDTLFASSAHAPVTVTDSSEIDFTLTVQNLTASIVPGSISSSKLNTAITTTLALATSSVQPGDAVNNLFLNAGGDIFYGHSISGGNLSLQSTTDATKGSILVGNTLEVDDSSSSVGIGGAPSGNSPLQIIGLPTSSVGLGAGEVWNDSGTLKIV